MDGVVGPNEQHGARLRSLYDAASPLPASPFRDATESFLRVGENGQTQAQRQAVPSDPAYDRPATVAEAFSAIDSGHMTRLRLGRMLLRAVPPDDQAEAIPIEDLVAVQGGAIVALLEHALRR